MTQWIDARTSKSGVRYTLWRTGEYQYQVESSSGETIDMLDTEYYDALFLFESKVKEKL